MVAGTDAAPFDDDEAVEEVTEIAEDGGRDEDAEFGGTVADGERGSG